MKPLRIVSLLTGLFLFCSSCTNNSQKTDTKEGESKESKIKEEVVNYKVDSLTMNSYVMYDENKEGTRPAILVVHEWWGLNDYIKRRTKMLAEMGYIAMAVDMYGNGKMGNDPEAAQKLAMPFYSDPGMAKKHFDAALEKLKAYPQVDQTKIAAIGYCFGGSMVLNMAKLGDNLSGIVSFHGILGPNPVANKDLLKSKILVCHGASDQFSPEKDIDAFKKQLDSIKADYTFKVYPNATHAFTNPQATELGQKFNLPIAYNGAADTASWNDMKDFFNRIFK